MAAWRCMICFVFVALSLKVLLSHINKSHSRSPDFWVYCGTDGCEQDFRVFNSFSPHYTDAPSVFKDWMPTKRMEYDAFFSTIELLRSQTSEANEEAVAVTSRTRPDIARSAAAFAISVREQCHLSQRTVNSVISGVQQYQSALIDTLRERIRRVFEENPDTTAQLQGEALATFDAFMDPFSTTAYGQNKTIRELFNPVNPEEVVVSQKIFWLKRAMDMHVFDSDGSDIDLNFEGFETEEEEENEFVPDDPLERAQQCDFLDTEEEEEEDEFRGFQVDWRTDNYLRRHTKPFSRTPGVKQPIPLDASPLDVFSLIFTDELWDTLVTETNRYAEQVRAQTPTTSKWTPVSKTEMRTFLGLCLCFGILKLPARRDYWRQTKWLYQTSVPRAMSRDRFDMIWRYLHLQDNLDPALDKSDKLWKIRRFMDLLLLQFQALYEVNGYVSVDESMVKYKGRLAFRQYLPMKPVKWGIKVWVMAESKTGYVNNFQVYTGAIAGKTETGLAHRIVSDLATPYFDSNLCLHGQLLH
ncbi:PiggyBac transposable element-derived protein 4 [Merluccius polli]|uniref:PiggyBac transposable element-derived protein 4 n=1 Tax=Merluccius polli TaxID=89951 RepID=A0AA47ML23_MERPO|nr:PiggyBac transposable element-derived protein 4 [Merluccius polli]